jgi:hypothetical protein
MDLHIDTQALRKSRVVHIIGISIVAIALLLGSFGLGVKVGYRKAHFSFKWAENYHQNFGGPKHGWMREFDDREYMDASGVTGQVLKVEGNTITVKGRDNVEKIVVLDEKTSLQRGREKIKATDLKANDMIVVIGEPNEQGQLSAKFIRLMPQPPARNLPPPLGADQPLPPNSPN